MLKVYDMFSGIGGFALGFQQEGFRIAAFAELDKYPCEVLAKNFPNIPNYGDVTQIKYEKDQFDLIIGGFPCFPARTPIQTKNGIKPIEHVAVGDMVLTHKLRYKKVTKIMSKENAPLIQIQAFGFPKFFVTADHPFYTRKKIDGKWELEPQWILAKDLDKSHYLANPLEDRIIWVPFEKISDNEILFNGNVYKYSLETNQVLFNIRDFTCVTFESVNKILKKCINEFVVDYEVVRDASALSISFSTSTYLKKQNSEIWFKKRAITVAMSDNIQLGGWISTKQPDILIYGAYDLGLDKWIALSNQDPSKGISLTGLAQSEINNYIRNAKKEYAKALKNKKEFEDLFSFYLVD